MKEVNTKIKEYVEKNIIPQYDLFDRGHDSSHANAVISRSLEYYSALSDNSIDINMVYVVAAYHDIGIKIAREGHPTHSKKILLTDENLKKWFSNGQIAIMADAVEDHSTSKKNPPRTIYGKIVSDADKDKDIEVGVLRGWEYAKTYMPDSSTTEKLENIHKEIHRRFCDNGVVVFYLPTTQNQAFMQEMRKFAYDKEYFFKRFFEMAGKNKWLI